MTTEQANVIIADWCKTKSGQRTDNRFVRSLSSHMTREQIAMCVVVLQDICLDCFDDECGCPCGDDS